MFFVCLSVCVVQSMSVCMTVYMTVCWSVSNRLTVCPTVCLSVCPSVNLSFACKFPFCSKTFDCWRFGLGMKSPKAPVMWIGHILSRQGYFWQRMIGCWFLSRVRTTSHVFENRYEQLKKALVRQYGLWFWCGDGLTDGLIYVWWACNRVSQKRGFVP